METVKMKIYAGIGSRQTPPNILTLMKNCAKLLAVDGYTCSTGAALGADQAFAEGALINKGAVNLHLPWKSYESDWANVLIGPISYFILQQDDIDAYESVRIYHPNYTEISTRRGVLALHARNYNILYKPQLVDFIICWTPDGKISGGTGQALRIAADNNIPVYNLGIYSIEAKFNQKIIDRINEL